MTRFSPARTPSRRLLAAAAAGTAALLVTVLAQLPGEAAESSVGPASGSADEVAAGLLARAASYPGGLPALLRLFETGPCAGVVSYETAPPACVTIVDEIAALGAGQPFPARLPDLAGDPMEPLPPEPEPDPNNQVTPELLAALAAAGAPPDLIEALSQDPPQLPPQYNTLPDFQGGPPGPFGSDEVPATDPPPPGSCRITYTTTDFTNGFTLNLTITNTGTSMINGWTVAFGFPAGQRITPPGWGATWNQAPGSAEVTAGNLAWNAAIPPNASVSIGVPGTTTGVNPPPTSFTLNSIPCATTTIPPPTTTATTTATTTTTTTATPPTSTTTPPVTTTPTTATSTTTTPPPPPPPPPLLVAVGDSVTSGHESRFFLTTCDDPVTSWANDLRALIGVPVNRYFNFAHSGASTADVLGAVPYTNPCGVVSQRARAQIADAVAVLRANPSAAGAANVAVTTAGVNNTNWVGVATQLVARRLGGAIARPFGAAPGWAVANRAACTDWVLGNPVGNPLAPPGAVPPAWNGAAVSGAMARDASTISLSLIAADPGAQVRYLAYYRWWADPNLPAVCAPAAFTATSNMNGWIAFGVLVARIVWLILRGNPNRIQAVCQLFWNPARGFIQDQLLSFGRNNFALVPGWPHPNAGGRAALGACVNGTLPRAPGGGIG